MHPPASPRYKSCINWRARELFREGRRCSASGSGAAPCGFRSRRSLCLDHLLRACHTYRQHALHVFKLAAARRMYFLRLHTSLPYSAFSFAHFKRSTQQPSPAFEHLRDSSRHNIAQMCSRMPIYDEENSVYVYKDPFLVVLVCFTINIRKIYAKNVRWNTPTGVLQATLQELSNCALSRH